VLGPQNLAKTCVSCVDQKFGYPLAGVKDESEILPISESRWMILCLVVYLKGARLELSNGLPKARKMALPLDQPYA
jgi:hypothetical protein